MADESRTRTISPNLFSAHQQRLNLIERFDFARHLPRRLIRRKIMSDVKLTDESTVSPNACRAVLRALLSFTPADARQGGPMPVLWATQPTLAERAGLSARTVKRVIAALIAAKLLAVTRPHHGLANRYEITWSVFFDSCSPPVTCPPPHNRTGGDTVAPRGDTVAPRGDTVAPRGDTVAPEHRNHLPSSYETNRHAHGDFVNAKKGGWERPITLADLSNFYRVAELFEEAREKWELRFEDRLNFFTQARSVRRRTQHPTPGKEPIRNPGAVFTAAIRCRRWDGSHADEEAAIEALRQLDQETYSPLTTHQSP